MTRISTFCVVTSALAALALSVSSAGAFKMESPKVIVPTPKVTVAPKVTANPPPPRTPGSDGQVFLRYQLRTVEVGKVQWGSSGGAGKGHIKVFKGGHQ